MQKRKYCELKLRKRFTRYDDDVLRENRFNDNIPMNNNSAGFDEKINYILSTKLGKHNILYTEEVDSLEKSKEDFKGAKGDHKLNTVKFKLVKQPRFSNPFITNEKKRIWYTQNVFSCTKKLVIGYFIDDFILENVKVFEMSDLVRDEIASLNYLNSILTFIKKSFIELDTNLLSLTYYEYSRELKCQVGNQIVASI